MGKISEERAVVQKNAIHRNLLQIHSELSGDRRVKSPKNFGCPAMNLLAIVLVITGIAIAGLGIFGIYWYRAQRALQQAKARALWLNRELERTDSQVQVVEVWSDEQIERNNRQRADDILDRVGTDLSADESVEAKRLRAFLDKIHTTSADSGLKTPRDIGRAWFACLQLQDNDPETELAQLFKVLNDAWTNRENQAEISALLGKANFRTIASSLRLESLKGE